MRGKKINGLRIHQRRDESGELIVADDGAVRSLYFGHVQQSSVRLDRPGLLVDDYSQAMMSVLAFRPRPRSILIIGLGGCALVHFILQACPECAVHVVEIRQSVIDVAYEFFALPRDNRSLEIFHAAGQDFIASRGKGLDAYDLILSDAFDEGGPAAGLLHPDFFVACRDRLAGSGILVMNLWTRPRDKFHAQCTLLRKVLGGTLLKLIPGEVHGNGLIFWSADSRVFDDLPSLRPAARLLQREHGFNAPKYLMCLHRQNLAID